MDSRTDLLRDLLKSHRPSNRTAVLRKKFDRGLNRFFTQQFSPAGKVRKFERSTESMLGPLKLSESFARASVSERHTGPVLAT